MDSVTKKKNEDHIAGKGQNSISQCMHKFIPMPQVMKIPDAKASVDKEWKKLTVAVGESQEQEGGKKKTQKN